MIGESIGLKPGKATREAFGETLRDIGGRDQNIVVLDGDLNNSTRTDMFLKAYPERFFNVGIAESNLAGMAAGVAACGKTALISSFATFMMSNAYDQLRMSIAFPNLNVKVVGSHAGISIGEDGPSQMGMEDVALACALPNFTVVVPADEPSARVLTEQVLALQGPCYLRTGRPKAAIIYEDTAGIEIGKAKQVRDGGDITIIANGLLVAAALEAAAELEKEGIQARILDMHTVKPLDVDAVAKAARETGRIVVAEEHLHSGALGAAVAQAVSQTCPVPMAYVDLGDRYAESGTPEELLEHYGMTGENIAAAARRLLG